jgi:YbbR domain-containing protein
MEEVKENVKNTGISKKIKNIKDKGTDLTLRILAFIIAVIIWFIMSITQFPTINKTIAGVHVDFNMEGTMAEDKGLAALNYKDITVDVEIRGMNYEIGTYTENDLIATVNLNDVTKEGTYTLDIDVKSSHTADRCTIVSVSPESIEVDFDRITQRNIEVTAEAPLVSAEEGYTLKETSVSPKEISVGGPKNELDKIDRVTARITKSKKLSEDISIKAEDLVFYDADGNKLDSSKFSISNASEFDVKFIIYKKKVLNLSVNIAGAPDGFDVSSIPMQLSEDKVSVITPHLDEPDEEDISLGNIPLTSIDLTKKFTFKIPLNTGEVNMSGNDIITASFDKEGYSSASFTLDADNIDIIGAPSEFTSEIDNEKLPNVVLYGPTEVVESLTNEDIYAKVSLDDIKEVGSYTKDIKIYAKGKNNVWCYGTNEVQITVSKPKTDESSSADSSVS